MKLFKGCGFTALAAALLLSISACFGTNTPQTDGVAESTSSNAQSEGVQTQAQTSAQTTAVSDSEAETITPPEDPVRISFIGMGDNLIHGCIYRQSETSNGRYDFLPKYADVADMISNADVAYINQETPMCGEKYGYSNYPQFNTPQQMGHDLVTLGFDVICLANNHVLDKTSKGLEDMLDFTDTLNAMIIGAFRSKADSENIRILECEGIKIGFLAYTYDTNIAPSKSSEAYVPYIGYEIEDTEEYVIDVEKITKDVKKAKKESDILIVSMHWGAENKSKVNSMQAEAAQLLADLGVDVILGHHPHVVQPIEWIKGNGGGKTLCYYSLGNGINAQDYLKNMVGITAAFDIVRDENGTHIENASCIPTFSYLTPHYKNVQLYLLENLTEKMASAHHSNKYGDKVTVENAYKVITDVIDGEFLPDYLKD